MHCFKNTSNYTQDMRKSQQNIFMRKSQQNRFMRKLQISQKLDCNKTVKISNTYIIHINIIHINIHKEQQLEIENTILLI